MIEISKVIITGGHETGGLHSFATTLAAGFTEIGIPSEVIPPGEIYRRWRDLRDRKVLKILSTTAVFAVPFARRAICIAHCLPRADVQGWVTALAIVASFKLTSWCSESRLVAVSQYLASHLNAIYKIKIHDVVHNPLNPAFFEMAGRASEKGYLTYIGRLHPVKNIDKWLPAMQAVLDECADEFEGLRICIAGEGPLRQELQDRFGKDSRVEFIGNLDVYAVREVLRKTRVFISGCETEGLGIAYLEALSQGCSIVIPACGGGLEIAPDLIGTQIQLMPLNFEHKAVKKAIRRALQYSDSGVSLNNFAPEMVAEKYLALALNYDRPIGSKLNRGRSIDRACTRRAEQSFSCPESIR